MNHSENGMGKRVSLHGVMFMFKNSDGKLITEFHDTFSDSDDT